MNINRNGILLYLQSKSPTTSIGIVVTSVVSLNKIPLYLTQTSLQLREENLNSLTITSYWKVEIIISVNSFTFPTEIRCGKDYTLIYSTCIFNGGILLLPVGVTVVKLSS